MEKVGPHRGILVEDGLRDGMLAVEPVPFPGIGAAEPGAIYVALVGVHVPDLAIRGDVGFLVGVKQVAIANIGGVAANQIVK